MERAKKDMYLRTGEPEKDDRVFSGDNSDEVKSFFKEMAEDEANRKQANKQAITNFESDLSEYDRMIVEEMKTIAEAQRIKQLLLGRLRVIKNFSTIQYEYKERYDEAIGVCELLIEKVNCALTYLPDKEAALPFLTRILTKKEQQFLYEKLVNNKFISGDFESFCYAFGGKETDNFQKIVWLKNKQSLRNLLRELKAENLTISETMKNAELYFTDAKGNKLNLPEKDRKHEENYDENFINKIIIEFRRL